MTAADVFPQAKVYMSCFINSCVICSFANCRIERSRLYFCAVGASYTYYWPWACNRVNGFFLFISSNYYQISERAFSHGLRQISHHHPSAGVPQNPEIQGQKSRNFCLIRENRGRKRDFSENQGLFSFTIISL